MSAVVLERWGVLSTSDIGEIVFTLVDLGFLAKLPNDTREEFVRCVRFRGAFERDYPWNCAYNA